MIRLLGSELPVIPAIPILFLVQPPADAAELVASGPPHPLAFLLLLLVLDVALPQLAVLVSAPHEAAGTLEAWVTAEGASRPSESEAAAADELTVALG